MAEPAKLEHKKPAHREQENKQEQKGQVTAPPEFSLSTEGGESQAVRNLDSIRGQDLGADTDYTVPQAIIINLRRREDWLEEVMLDELGLPIAGMKHVLTAAEKELYKVGDKVPTEVLEAWAQADAWKAYEASLGQCNILGVNDKEFVSAMTSVNFQLGTTWNKIHKKAWGHMAAHEWEEAALMVEESSWHDQTPERVEDFQEALRTLNAKAPSSTTVTDAGDGKSAYAFQIGPQLAAGKVVSKMLNVRLGPGTQYEKSGVELKIGDLFPIFGIANGWYCMGEGQWLAGQYVELDSTFEAQLPISEPDVLPNLKPIAQNVYDAMFAGPAWGADENKAFANLAQLNKDGRLIAKFKQTYAAMFGREVEADIRAEFSDTFLGSEQTTALGYLQEGNMRQSAPDRQAKAEKGSKDSEMAPIQLLEAKDWCSQLRFGYNFSAKEIALEKAYLEKLKQFAGLDDPAELFAAPKKTIAAIKADPAFSKGTWSEEEALKQSGLREAEKAKSPKPNWACSLEASAKMSKMSLKLVGDQSNWNPFFTEISSSEMQGRQQNEGLILALERSLRQGKAVLGKVTELVSAQQSSAAAQYICIMGMEKEAKEVVFSYFDPATSIRAAGNSSENKLQLDPAAQLLRSANYLLTELCFEPEIFKI